MSTITKEQVIQIEAAAKEVLWPIVWTEKKARAHFSKKVTPEIVLELARIARAYMDIKPPMSLEEEQKSAAANILSCDDFIVDGVLVECPHAHRLSLNGWNDKYANETVTMRDVYMEYRKLVDSIGIDISKQPTNVRDAMWYGYSLAKSSSAKMTDGDK